MEEESSMEFYIKEEEQESLQEDVKQSCIDEEGWIEMCAEPEMPSTALSSDPQASETVLIALGQESVLEVDDRIGENSQESSERESLPPTHQERNSLSFDVLIKEEFDSWQNEEDGRCFNGETRESGDDDRGGNNESCECKVTEPTGSVCSYCKKKHERTDSGGKTSLQCFFCDCSFFKECHLTRHLQSHVGIQTYDTFHCSLCKKSFLSNSDLVKHKTKCTGEKPYQCIHCTSTFAIQTDLKVHVRTHNQVKNILTVQTQDQTDHSYGQSQAHSRKKQYSRECPYCKRFFSSKFKCDRHIGTMTFESSYSCSLCSSTFPSKCSLTLHNGTHLEKSYQCSLCSKTFTSLYRRRRHMKCRTGVKLHECSICNKTFPAKCSLREHRRTHAGKNFFESIQCGKKFSRNRYLKQHLDTHTGSGALREYKCSLCSKVLKSMYSRNKHEKIHTGERPHECLYCSRRFFQKCHLKDHIRIHTKEKPYKCDYCCEAFTYKKTYNVHMIKHSGQMS